MKQSQAKITNSREGTSGDWQKLRRCGRSKEGKLSVSQTELEGTRTRVSGGRKTFQWRMPQAKGQQSFKGGLSN